LVAFAAKTRATMAGMIGHTAQDTTARMRAMMALLDVVPAGAGAAYAGTGSDAEFGIGAAG
jgi:hypothetical protein